MTQTPNWIEDTAAPSRTRGWWRWVAGTVLVLATVTAAVAFVLGSWNPWRYVVLLRYFANPWLGVAVVGVLAYLTMWVLLPVRNEARQRGRLATRVTVVVVTLIGLGGWGLFGPLFAYQASELARSADGERAVADVTAGGKQERELRVWEGSGWTTREVGSFGRPCASPSAEFLSRDLVVINQGHGDWEFHLDPATGQPRQVLGPRCSDGPVPATMGP